MKKISSTICAIPFVSIMVNTDTTIRYCCMVNGNLNKIRKENGVGYTIKDQFVKEAWNSQDMRDIRLAMIKGERVAGCSVCYFQEESGRKSNREHANEEWAWRLGENVLIETIKNALNNNGVVDNDLVYLDLRLGNLCNLKCRMCNPWNSSQIAKEHIELNSTNERYSSMWKGIFGNFQVESLDDQKWFDSDILWDQVISLIPSLKKVYMTGGEPTLIKNNFKFMQSCIDQDRKDIVLFFNTNCTNVNSRFLELITQFDNVNINASIDGIGAVNDYIRAPSNWNSLNQNIEKLANLPNVNLGITPTVQIYNIFDLVNILSWVDYLNEKYSKKIFVDFLINVHPHHLSVTILPDNMKNDALSMLEKYIDTQIPKDSPELTKNSINGIIGLLKREAPADKDYQLSVFKEYTTHLDIARNQSIESVDSRFKDLINGRT